MLTLNYNLELERCPHCNVDSPNLTRLWSCETTDHKNTNMRWWDVYKCLKCGGLVTAASKGKANGNVVEFYPSTMILDDSIPHPAFDYLSQALESLHAPAGSIMVSASSIDAMLKNKGYTEGKLYTRINKAATDHLITKEMASWAHEIRLDANEQRHSDNNGELPNQDDAQKTFNFALALAEYLFVLPSKVNKGLKKDNVEKDNNSNSK